MRRRTLYNSYDGIKTKPIEEATYADVCFVDNDTLDKFIVGANDLNDNFNTELYTPIGVVVVPSSHTSNNRPRIMSTVHMDCDKPTIGGNGWGDNMYWGETRISISVSSNNILNPYISHYNTGVTINETVKFGRGVIILPSDANGENGLDKFEYENPSNPNEHFCNGDFGTYYCMCSPYKQDGSKDIRYFEEPSSANVYSILADFNGRSNTDKILAQRGSKDYTSWKPVYYYFEDYPAASCCDIFYTVGTNQCDWYLPSAGELGYVIARMQAIQNSLATLRNKGYNINLPKYDEKDAKSLDSHMNYHYFFLYFSCIFNF